jgi:hypothetical protein
LAFFVGEGRVALLEHKNSEYTAHSTKTGSLSVSAAHHQAKGGEPGSGSLHIGEMLRGKSPADLLVLRVLLLGFAVALQTYHEIPSEAVRALFGLAGASVLSFALMAVSLVCLCLAVSPKLPGWVIGKLGRGFAWATLIICLVLAVLGLRQVGLMVVESFEAPYYPNDGTLLDHNAAVLLLHGENPYVASDIVAAIRTFHQPADFTTPLQQGLLANQQDYPTKDQLRTLLAQEPVGQPGRVLEFESHVSYPALSFLVLVPLVWAGWPTVLPFYVLCLALLAFFGLRAVRPELRWLVALIFLADLPVLNSTLAGDLDIFYILLVFLAWLWWDRWWWSAVLFGLALASKQLAWFYFPFYLIFVYQRRGWREAALRTGVAGLVFLVPNLPFMLLDGQAWAAGVLAPLRDPMFPAGAGIIALGVGKMLPFLPHGVYTVLEGVGMLGALAWYYRWGRQRSESAMVLAVLPLFLAWRSLPTYFYFCALPAALLLALAPRMRSDETRHEAGDPASVGTLHKEQSLALQVQEEVS